MAGVIPFDTWSFEQKPAGTSYTYGLDLEKGRILGKVDGLTAVRQYIQKALLTPRFKCLIYDSQYGSELDELIKDRNSSEDYMETEIPRMVEDALLADGRIVGVSAFHYFFDLEKEEAHISFMVDTIFGTADMEEVIT